MKTHSSSQRAPIRVLVVDDEQAVRDAYEQVFAAPQQRPEQKALTDLRSRLFAGQDGGNAGKALADSPEQFSVQVCSGAEAAVEACRQACATDQRFHVAFIDMRMPPGPDGLWAAEQIRAIDGDVEIVICTAFSDVDIASVRQRVQPADKLFYLQKPFNSHGVLALALALGHKWAAHQRISGMAYFDSLTGLPNRNLFRDHLSRAIDHAQNTAGTLAVLYFDLDNFKRVNDTLGHGVGDDLLRTVSRRIANLFPKEQRSTHQQITAGSEVTFARMGGDEFAVLLQGIAGPDEARSLADKIVHAFREPIALSQHQVVTTTSIGISLYPANGDNADDLCRHADLAMSFAKRQGPGRVAYFNETMSAGGLKRLTLEAGLRDAMHRNELVLYYQPQFRLSTGEITGFEALLRWNSAEYGDVPPAEFIPLAEETGLIKPIGQWVMRTACLQMKRWLDAGLTNGRIGVNVSALQFAQEDFLDVVASTLQETQLPAKHLEIELTESLLLQDEVRTAETCRKLRALGVIVALDDFGTGYSGLNRLRQFAVDRIKIDRAFVQHMHDNMEDRALCIAVIKMAQTLGLGVIAEGVESFPQLLLLQEERCEHGQGYLFSKPLTVSAAEELLHRGVESHGLAHARRVTQPDADPQQAVPPAVAG